MHTSQFDCNFTRIEPDYDGSGQPRRVGNEINDLLYFMYNPPMQDCQIRAGVWFELAFILVFSVAGARIISLVQGT